MVKYSKNNTFLLRTASKTILIIEIFKNFNFILILIKEILAIIFNSKIRFTLRIATNITKSIN
jgi:hypothetical protein